MQDRGRCFVCAFKFRQFFISKLLLCLFLLVCSLLLLNTVALGSLQPPHQLHRLFHTLYGVDG